ncbi:hypothetical protein Pelo_8806 [Pelomyxa schiedti]|nr:hypothetical protein Pelo_8806 [Pelomyxa schiedti]
MGNCGRGRPADDTEAPDVAPEDPPATAAQQPVVPPPAQQQPVVPQPPAAPDQAPQPAPQGAGSATAASYPSRSGSLGRRLSGATYGPPRASESLMRRSLIILSLLVQIQIRVKLRVFSSKPNLLCGLMMHDFQPSPSMPSPERYQYYEELPVMLWVLSTAQDLVAILLENKRPDLADKLNEVFSSCLPDFRIVCSDEIQIQENGLARKRNWGPMRNLLPSLGLSEPATLDMIVYNLGEGRSEVLHTHARVVIERNGNRLATLPWPITEAIADRFFDEVLPLLVEFEINRIRQKELVVDVGVLSQLAMILLLLRNYIKCRPRLPLKRG